MKVLAVPRLHFLLFPVQLRTTTTSDDETSWIVRAFSQWLMGLRGGNGMQRGQCS